MTPFLHVEGLTRHFEIKSGKGLFAPKATVRAVDDVSFGVQRGETLGIVGESGCGKSTTGRLVLGMLKPTAGTVMLDGETVHARHDAVWRLQRRRVQMVYQDPMSFLDKRLPIGRQVIEPMTIHGIGGSMAERRARAQDVLSVVGMRPDQFDSYPHELSGGQRQRVILARALMLEPELLVCDEPVSALDVSVAAQVVNLLKDLQSERGLTYLFISHDLKIVRQVADRVMVMYLGKVMETATTAELYRRPLHPYTQTLLSAVPSVKPTVQQRVLPQGDPPNPSEVPEGCVFNPRCPFATDLCRSVRPAVRTLEGGRSIACHHPQELMSSSERKGA
ncbi:ABC transporter ATP-binding protein [Rhizobium miluonense]|uniref:Peptide/nickel transport system ATP-binding protein n=1 Tax=Rhizobium miluonense TaxID=411945 RepID=A0A1C3WE82_9HYPH|nr:oligopeptide/dipeptide ABC transporter ATP-binding protein [Rhizobium miluonense]SCB38186.1 peptide/nickel transport system ATP-binding protein [Rhizobium miluonense]